jgi:hypothetical protein
MVQQRVGAMLVSKRVWEGSDGSAIFILDESRSAATSLFGLAFFDDWSLSPWSLLLEGGQGTSLMHHCVALRIGSGMHVDVSDLADGASPVERRLLNEAVAGGLRSIYMLHAADGLVVQFASWMGPCAFRGMEAELLEFADAHVLNVPQNVPPTDVAQVILEIATAMKRLDQFQLRSSPAGSSTASAGWEQPTASSDSISSLMNFADSLIHSVEHSSRLQLLGGEIADIFLNLGKQRLPEVATHMLAAIPKDKLADLAPAVLLAVPPELIATVLPAALELLPATVVPAIVRTVVASLPLDKLADLAPAVLLAVPPELIATVLPAALELLPATVVPAIVRTVVASLPLDKLAGRAARRAARRAAGANRNRASGSP